MRERKSDERVEGDAAVAGGGDLMSMRMLTADCARTPSYNLRSRRKAIKTKSAGFLRPTPERCGISVMAVRGRAGERCVRERKVLA